MATLSSCAVTYSQVFHVQMLQEGFYHSDPHPGEQHSFQMTAACVMLLVKCFMSVVFVVAGNLFRTADGRLAYIDFGMMGEIEPLVRRCAHPSATKSPCVTLPRTLRHANKAMLTIVFNGLVIVYENVPLSPSAFKYCLPAVICYHTRRPASLWP